MVAVGITRFKITDILNGRGAHRFSDSEVYWEVANNLYREIFAHQGTPLAPGENIIKCSKDEFTAGYDYQLGIDVILYGDLLGEATLQEKFLFTGFNTLTIEHCQNWLTLEPGDWFKMKAQYYFVGYDKNRQTKRLNPWVLCDLARLHKASGQRRIPWQLKGDWKEGAQASFIYCELAKLPGDVLVSSSIQSYSIW